MTIQVFRDMLKAQPFKPVRIVTSSGEKYEIRHPEMALLTRSDLLIGMDVRTKQGVEVPGYHKTVSLLHITAIEPIAAEHKPKRK